jgi:hypothetical protein
LFLPGSLEGLSVGSEVEGYVPFPVRGDVVADVSDGVFVGLFIVGDPGERVTARMLHEFVAPILRFCPAEAERSEELHRGDRVPDLDVRADLGQLAEGRMESVTFRSGGGQTEVARAEDFASFHNFGLLALARVVQEGLPCGVTLGGIGLHGRFGGRFGGRLGGGKRFRLIGKGDGLRLFLGHDGLLGEILVPWYDVPYLQV